MPETNTALEWAKSEAEKFLKEISEPDIKDNIFYLEMALKSLSEEIYEESKERRSGAGLGEISQIQAKTETNKKG